MPREATEAGQCEPSVTTNFDSDDTTFENLVKATMRTGKDFEPSGDDIYYGWFVTSPEINTHPDRQHGQTTDTPRASRENSLFTQLRVGRGWSDGFHT